MSAITRGNRNGMAREHIQKGKRIQFEVNFNIGDSWQKKGPKTNVISILSRVV